MGGPVGGKLVASPSAMGSSLRGAPDSRRRGGPGDGASVYTIGPVPDQTLTPLPVADARDLLLARLAPLAAERVAVSPELAGRVLAEPVRAPTDIPRFANSAMDGYALRAADARAGAIPVAFAIAAGDDPPPLPPGACAQIATGAPLPDGADSIVPVERSSAADGTVELEGAVAPGDFVRTPGEDVRAGDEVLAAGTHLGPLSLAAIAAVGAAGASVRAPAARRDAHDRRRARRAGSAAAARADPRVELRVRDRALPPARRRGRARRARPRRPRGHEGRVRARARERRTSC